MAIFDPDDPNGQNGQNGQGGQGDPNRNGQRNNRQIDYTSYLRSIDNSLKELIRISSGSSQSNSRIFRDDLRNRQQQNNRFGNNNGRNRFGSDARSTRMGSFTDEFEKVFMENFLGSGYEQKIKNVFNNLADSMGVAVEDIPGAFGKQLGEDLLKSIKQTNFGKELDSAFSSIKDKAMSGLGNAFNKGFNNYRQRQDSSAPDVDAWSMLNRAMSGGADDAAGALSSLVNAAGGASSGLVAMLGSVGLAVGAVALLDDALEAAVKYVTGPFIEGFKKLTKSLGNAMNRDQESRRQMIKNQQERIDADVKTLVEEPFNILKDAAQEWFNFWDNQMHNINQTQGYSKADLQDLMSSYAQRLRDEGLTSVVSSADIGESLAKVIDAGLTGPAAEEFAYLATVLQAAVPTQDFYSYADQYAQLAASAMNSGMSQTEAIEYATSQLEQFASTVIYTSRQTGGFAAGLKDTGSLLSDAIKIAQSARTGNVAEISSVLTAIAGTVGAVAPDISGSIVDQVVKTAIGGNSSDLVALRSLAGINASNTEFLQALATDPQGVFTAIFKNLARYQNMAPEAYMEVAEGLSSVFGISQDAFARVDFNYLADQIANMNVNTASLEENLALLKSGESTTTTEQLRMQQINKYMIEEGLSYVLDNEAARAIQEHMWSEQIANEIMQNEFAVDLHGSALDFLQGICDTIQNLFNLLNPANWAKKVMNVIVTADQTAAQDADLLEMLERGKVGPGNQQELYNLVTRGVKLDLIDPLVELMGGISRSSALNSLVDNMWKSPAERAGDLLDAVGTAIGSLFGNPSDQTSSAFGSRTSYTWGRSVTKSQAAAAASVTSGLSGMASRILAESKQREKEQAELAQQVMKMTESSYMYGEFVKNHKTYEEWVESAKKFGIEDWDAALLAAGINEQDLRKQFAAYETGEGSAMKAAEWDDQWDFRAKSRQFYIDQIKMDEEMIARLDIIIDNQEYFIDSWKNFVNVWLRYMVLHEVYNASYDYSKVEEVQRAEKAGTYDSITALAESLASNMTDLKDPQIQTNAILAKILLSVLAIEEENKKEVSANGFLDSLVGLASGY